jgi:phosphohistidine phosphatase SixA
MKLYFFRHAEAEDHADSRDDHDRDLTAKGVARTKTAGQVLAALDLRLTHLYTSPRVRATHTAEILARALNLTAEVRDELNFDFDVTAVEKLIAGLSDEHEVLFVGHEPSMSLVVGELTGGNVLMKKGGMARVDVVTAMSPLRGQLAWLIAPKVFDALGAKS